ncbi:hypothetical protein V1478_001638 [Vespula squamosa]|uniref:Uncharacterized protein n=1 Tax=Vespula squamosa TaxID=30214 RepID=A0ABD2C210_VESSQ
MKQRKGYIPKRPPQIVRKKPSRMVLSHILILPCLLFFISTLLCFEFSIVTFLVGLDIHIVKKRSSLSFADFASLGNSLLLLRIVPSNVVRFVNNFVASNALVKKLSVVKRLQHRKIIAHQQPDSYHN